MKIRCSKCREMAIWMYMPETTRTDIYFCDACVHRGCSCNVDPNTGIEDKGEDGRYLPCCEYMDCEEGFDDSLPLNDSDLYDE